jgi:hypothetical protein
VREQRAFERVTARVADYCEILGEASRRDIVAAAERACEEFDA